MSYIAVQNLEMGKALKLLMETYTEAHVDIQILFILYPLSPESQKIHMEQDISVSIVSNAGRYSCIWHTDLMFHQERMYT